MKHPNRMRYGLIAVLCVSVGAAGGIAGGTAATSKHKGTAGKTRSSRLAAPGEPPPPGPGGFGGPFRFAVHEEEVVLNRAGTAFITATEDNGTVDSVSGDRLSVKEGTKSVAYKTVTVTVPDAAKVYRNGAVVKLAELTSGDHVHVSQSSDGTVVLADDATHRPWHRGFGGHGRDGHRGPPPFGAPPM